MLDGSKWGKQKDEGYMSASDEEILPLEGLSEDEDEDEEDGQEEVSDGQDDDRSLMDEEEQEEDDLDNEAWGSSRKVYYGADDVSDDEDVAREEQEAGRLQKKHLARLRPEDFIDTWTDAPTTTIPQPIGRVVIEELPAPDLSNLSKPEILKILKSRHPEVSRLATLYQLLHPQLSSLSLLAERPFHPQHTTIKLKHAVLSVFLSSIAIFFAVRADESPRPSLQKRLVTKISETEHLWKQISTIPIDENALDIQALESTEADLDAQIEQPAKLIATPKSTTRKRKREVKTLADSDDDDDLAASLAALKKVRSTSKPPPAAADDLDDFADVTTLHPLDAQEKRQNKKTLRFYTAQIENKSQKRREKYSGDTEVFKERRNDRAERTIEAARKRGLPSNTNGDDAELDDEEPVPTTQTGEKEDGYYDFVAAKAARKKASGKQEYEASKASAKAFLRGEGDGGLDESGKRLITRQIEKNKGLMPHRNKDVRNPRVKKRKKYEKRKVALKGRQAVYKVGDVRRGAYGGEESGISKNVVKGVKLS